MPVLKGLPVSPGFASGCCSAYDFEIESTVQLPRRRIEESELQSERSRLNAALKKSRDELQHAERSATAEPIRHQSAGVLSAHATIAKEIAELVMRRIDEEFVNVELALDTVLADLTIRLQRLDNSILRQREQDVRDVERRMMRNLNVTAPWSQRPVPPGSVIVARELFPSDAIALAHSGVVGIVSEHGGAFSHTAIIARSLEIPAVTGISDVAGQIKAGMRVLVDGDSGTVVIEPSPADEQDFAARQLAYERHHVLAPDEQRLPCMTTDGTEVKLLANISQPEEVKQVLRHHLKGVGLFRTEFLFLQSHQRPSYQSQVDRYQNVANGMESFPLVIRTFDLGGDKIPPFLQREASDAHSSLHLRGLRFSLSEKKLLETQLRAILHVAETADVRILFPMVVGSNDFEQAVEAVHRVAKQSGTAKIPPLGAMIETPAALFALDEILDLADFAAIGTNDLTQYLLAADRDLVVGSDDCTALHPAVLRAIKQIVRVAQRLECPLCVCGEEAGDPSFACLLIGLGVDVLSISPPCSPEVQRAVRRLNRSQAETVAQAALAARSPRAVRELIRQWNPAAVQPGQDGTVDP